MGERLNSISPEDLVGLIGTEDGPFVFDVRRKAAYEAASRVIASARWRDHLQADTWAGELPLGAKVVVYCVHGHEVSQSAAARLRLQGLNAAYLQGGIEAFQAAGGVTIGKTQSLSERQGQPIQWVTAETPKLARMACIWLIRRFIDPDARMASVSEGYVVAVAKELAAQPFATAESDAFSDFAAFFQHFDFAGGALARCSDVLRKAERSAEIGEDDIGLALLWNGLVAGAKDEERRLQMGLILFDGLYAALRREGPE